MVTRVGNSKASARVGHGGKVANHGVSPTKTWGCTFEGRPEKRINLAKLKAIVEETVADNSAQASVQGHTALLQECKTLLLAGVGSIVVSVADCAHVCLGVGNVKVLYKFVCADTGQMLSRDTLCASVFEEMN